LAARRNRNDEQGECYRRAIAVLEALDGPGAETVPYQQDLLRQYTNLAALLTVTGPTQEMEKVCRRRVDLCRHLADAHPDSASLQSDLALAQHTLAGHLWRSSRSPEARTLLEEAIRHQRAAVKANPNEASYRQALLLHHAVLGSLLVDLGSHAAAARTLTDLLTLVPGQWPRRAQVAELLARCSSLALKDRGLSEAERRAQARRHADQAVEVLGQAIKQGFKDRVYLEKTADFDVLRDRADFKALLKNVPGP
jgi:tetratricopeptide (TPR) repeat protein